MPGCDNQHSSFEVSQGAYAIVAPVFTRRQRPTLKVKMHSTLMKTTCMDTPTQHGMSYFNNVSKLSYISGAMY
jgi:hypothetical protein